MLFPSEKQRSLLNIHQKKKDHLTNDSGCIHPRLPLRSAVAPRSERIRHKAPYDNDNIISWIIYGSLPPRVGEITDEITDGNMIPVYRWW